MGTNGHISNGHAAAASVSGVVIDVHRFAVNDGPGIRTTVFLKGCPLKCIWCHNPESQCMQPELYFDASRCNDCMECVSSCPAAALYISGDKLKIDRSRCDACGICVPACSRGALKVIGASLSVDAVLETVSRDRAYYERSGGGLTVSGGEPMYQFEFTSSLLRKAKEAGLHTCLDTSGAARREYLEAVLPYVDVFLYDYKATDPEEHRKWTGISNALILDNLDFLYRNGGAVILRCPLVPQINDSIEHLEGIAQLSAKYPELQGVEILPYHNMAREKALSLGRESRLLGLPAASEKSKQRWLKFLRAFGCERAVLA